MTNFARAARLAAVSSTAWLAIALAPSAYAQTEATPAAEPEAEEEVVVTGIRASLENALDIRRKADVILDGISADDIGSTPDLNLG